MIHKKILVRMTTEKFDLHETELRSFEFTVRCIADDAGYQNKIWNLIPAVRFRRFNRSATTPNCRHLIKGFQMKIESNELSHLN